ncbi:hypothetical protein [Neorhodopirellula lusitana]|uniref:hypothetical protein n=1 Tax=Neorhodopirellula lusitana TaxID=445327 RepID=UPI00384C3BB8
MSSSLQPTRLANHTAKKASGVACWAIVLLTLLVAPNSATAQNGFASAPQTNLSPISPTYPDTSGYPGTSAYPGGSMQPPSGLAPLSTPSFDPYASNPTGTGFTGVGGTTITPLGTPTPLGPPTYAGGPTTFSPNSGFPPSSGYSPNAVTGGNPAYPNGGLLNGLFSGNWFRGASSNAGVYQGAAYPSASGFPSTTGSIIPYGSPTGSAATYSAPPIYGDAPPAGDLYGSGPILGAPSSSAFPPSAYPSGSPTSLFPSGFNGPSGLFPNGGFTGYQVLHGPRLRHTWISGGDATDEVGMNQTDFSMGFAWNNFLYSNRPLYIVPSFSLYLFDGPVTTGSTRDLPGNAYAGFLDFGWQTDPNQIIGGEVGVRVGAYTDFDTFNSDSIRIMGKALIAFRLTPTTTLKAGLYYLDRDSIKMLPAGGLLWQPDPYTRFDLFFPEPKFARYWRTIGTQDVWWYLAGEYGGDSWTMTRANKVEERVDINQIGVTFGFEWGLSNQIRMGQRTAFIEAGVVFDRELKYEFSTDDQSLNEAFMVRGGWGY